MDYEELRRWLMARISPAQVAELFDKTFGYLPLVVDGKLVPDEYNAFIEGLTILLDPARNYDAWVSITDEELAKILEENEGQF